MTFLSAKNDHDTLEAAKPADQRERESKALLNKRKAEIARRMAKEAKT